MLVISSAQNNLLSMARIFTSLLLTALLLDAGIAAPVPDEEAITLLLEALLQEAYAEPHQAVQKLNENTHLQLFGNNGESKFRDDQQLMGEEQDLGYYTSNPRSEIVKYLQQFIQQQTFDQARAQEQYNFIRARTFGGAMGYDRARQGTGENQASLAQLSHFSQQTLNQGVARGRGDG